MTIGCAFAAPSGTIVQFVGWRSELMVRSGMILLDATADIDGVSHICPWRQHVKTPQAHYGNLDIVHVPQHTRQRLSEYLKKAANQRAYVKWMGHRANEGDLASMKTLNSKAKGVDLIGEGHRLRWTKQLALRGRGRTYDQHGLCGKQRLVISSD